MENTPVANGRTAPPPPGALGAADRMLTVLETALLFLAFGVMITVMFGQGVLSNVLDFEWPWARKLALNMMVLATGAGASVAVRENAHVAIGALTNLLPVRARALVAAAVAAFCVFACAAFLDSALAYVDLYRTDLQHMVLRVGLCGARCNLPLWTTRLALPFTLGLLMARFSLLTIMELRTVIRGAPPPQEDAP